jgi:phosphomannomutase
MIRSVEQRAARQEEMRSALQAREEEPKSKLYTVKETARELKVSLSTAYNMVREEKDGVHRIFTRGSNTKPIIRIERRVIERILRRSSAT